MISYIKAQNTLIPSDQIIQVDIDRIEEGLVIVATKEGIFECHGFDAIETVMLLKPSALEGKRFKWNKNAWAFHNIVAHPIVQILSWLGFKKEAVRFHDYTTPKPRDFKKITQKTRKESFLEL